MIFEKGDTVRATSENMDVPTGGDYTVMRSLRGPYLLKDEHDEMWVSDEDGLELVRKEVGGRNDDGLRPVEVSMRRGKANGYFHGWFEHGSDGVRGVVEFCNGRNGLYHPAEIEFTDRGVKAGDAVVYTAGTGVKVTLVSIDTEGGRARIELRDGSVLDTPLGHVLKEIGGS